jgi:hypothetical protein
MNIEINVLKPKNTDAEKLVRWTITLSFRSLPLRHQGLGVPCQLIRYNIYNQL